MSVCKSECYRCLSTCRYERTIVPPGLYINDPAEFALLGRVTATADPMNGAHFDLMNPSYRCEVDQMLTGPNQVPWLDQYIKLPFIYKRPCTSAAPPRLSPSGGAA
eukprot:CAMPEP_0113666658 /NCGR_PEP_ID=MMETSP0038_2-20120614/3001_1 /TAXON_ID=2898 /ORGANISM="Cryptomonas paramecium" /LENGTH=105 /DNA_ID=CAMNT_0000582183 /DNA_START=310 /DNA_END=624 /DNA_ORIENTATION=+ /assembly_acc=CAM_ASM_000170